MTTSRRAFLESLGIIAGGVAAAPLLGQGTPQGTPPLKGSQRPQDAKRTVTAPRASEFVFARLRYDSGDWDYNPKVAGNVLDAVLQYTTIPVHEQEVVISADSTEIDSFPFVFMTGHKLVRFSERERKGLERFVTNGGLLFSDDCNHDINGLYAKSFETEMQRAFPGSGPLAKLAKGHPIYRSLFQFDGPPRTSHEINGWGDNIVHDYVRGIERKGRLGVVYTNQDYGCEWDYSWRNKRFRTNDNTKFAVNLVVYAMT